MAGKVRLRIGRWFETEAEADGNIIQGLTSVFGPKGAEAFFLGNGFYVKAMADIPPKERRDNFPTVQVVDGGLYERELPETLRIDGKSYTLREVIKQTPESVADDLEEVVQSVDVPKEPRAFEVPDKVIEELENLRSVNGLITGLFEKIQTIESSSGQKEVNLLNMYDALLIEYIPKLPPEIANVVREMAQAKISKILVGKFLQRKDEITRRGKEGGLNVFEEYGRLLEEYAPRLSEEIATIIQREILVERAYDVAHQRFKAIESNYDDAQKTIIKLREELEQAKTGADPKRIRELEEELVNANKDYARLERVDTDLKEENKRLEASLLGKDAEHYLELEEANRQNVGLSLENESLRQRVSGLEEGIRNAESVFQEQERGYLGNIERLNQEIGRLERMLGSGEELEVVDIGEGDTQPFEAAPVNAVSASVNANLAIDYQQVLGAFAYVVDNVFFSMITNGLKSDKIGKLKEKYTQQLEAKYKETVPHKIKTGRKISQEEQLKDFDEYAAKQKEYVREKLPEMLENAESGVFTQEFYDSAIGREIEGGSILKAVQKMKLGQNFREVSPADKEILVEFADALSIYALCRAEEQNKHGKSDASIASNLPFVRGFLLKIYELMKIKGEASSFSTIAEKQYDSIKGQFKPGKPIFGRQLKPNDMEEIIKLADSSVFIGFDNTPDILGDEYI